MNNLKTKYKKILNELKENVGKENFSLKKRKPMMTDLEIIALSLAAECSSLDSECQLFRNLPRCLKGKIERSVYNRRRRSLFIVYEDIRRKLSSVLLKDNNRFVVDSMPLEICKKSRASRSKICKENPYANLILFIVPVNKCTIMDTNCMLYVVQTEFLQVLT